MKTQWKAVGTVRVQKVKKGKNIGDDMLYIIIDGKAYFAFINEDKNNFTGENPADFIISQETPIEEGIELYPKLEDLLIETGSISAERLAKNLQEMYESHDPRI